MDNSGIGSDELKDKIIRLLERETAGGDCDSNEMDFKLIQEAVGYLLDDCIDCDLPKSEIDRRVAEIPCSDDEKKQNTK